MELKINASEFKVFGKDGKKYGVMAIFNGDSLALSTPDLYVEKVPFDMTDIEGIEDGNMICRVNGDQIKGAGAFIRVKDWAIGGENPLPLAIGQGDTLNEYQVNVDGFKNSLSWLLQASSYDEGRPNLQGVHVAVKDGLVDMVATDGHRLGWDQAINEVDCPDCAFTIRNTAIETALKLVGKKGDIGTMTIRESVYPSGCLRDSMVSFTGIPNVHFPKGVIDLEYPEFRKVIPNSGFEFSFTAEFQAIKAFVKENQKVAKSPGMYAGRYSDPLVMFNVRNDGVRVYVKDGNGEVISQELRGGFAVKREPNQETGETESFEIAFNVNYLKDALDGMTGEPDDTITFNCKGAASACLIQDRDRKCVIMPVRM